MHLAPANKDNIYVENDVRISVITDRIIRIEKGEFSDNCTQAIMCRNFANPHFNIQSVSNKVVVVTNEAVFYIDKKSLETWAVFDNNDIACVPNNKDNMGGTARTLDGTFGVLGGWKGRREKKDHFFIGHIRKGIFSVNGVSEYDDSHTFLIAEDGSLFKRKEGAVDKYIFAFRDDYLGGLKEFYSLTGHTPILPKYALGNWWSRYHAYTQDEYTSLMQRFEDERIPLTVATIDMDWHIVKNTPKDAEYKSFQGAGWTGYTFERDLIPDPKGFLKDLKDRGLAITMNLHPRDGVRYFEEQYEDMARACGIDPASKKTVQFNLTDEKFRNAYFDILHHPYEEMGVDFWWIDWQQGTKDKESGLDPLWLLNHYHTMDICRDGNKGIILSRYAGLGSHRYPLGFSGDTIVCWKSLKFQPYFTALASNAGYTWWSHDIGGHLFTNGDNELYLRWVQLGVFSPVNRLHSNNMAMSKEPWNYPTAEENAKKFLRLRHRLLPYLYSANIRTANDGVPLISPLYYYTRDKEAYSKEYRNEYYFGEQLLVAPVTDKADEDGVTRFRVWLPNGDWTHFFTGEKFEGGRVHDIECPMDIFPVFAKAGAIVPLIEDRDGNSMAFDRLDIRIFAGNNSYTMHDENGSIHFDMNAQDGLITLDINVDGEIETRNLNLIFEGVESATVLLDGKNVAFDALKEVSADTHRVELKDVR